MMNTSRILFTRASTCWGVDLAPFVAISDEDVEDCDAVRLASGVR